MRLHWSHLLKKKDSELTRHARRIDKLNKYMKKYPEADRDQVWHTLLALDEDPWTRLDRGLLRAQMQGKMVKLK